ncbi:MAG: ABC transporter permease [Candidatus Aminicenantes bacterium]|nr:ABC transporter permease [Candidatus Aminicenantes bacterium]
MSENHPKLPRFAAFLLKKSLPKEEILYLYGDIKEIYFDLAASKGRLAARLWLWSQVFLSSPRFIRYSLSRRTNMIKNYLQAALRSMKKQKGITFINLAGLALGMACCLLILSYIRSEKSFDTFHKNADRIFRVSTVLEVRGDFARIAVSNHPIGPTLMRDYPEVESAVRIRPLEGRTLVAFDEKQFLENEVMLADNTLFDVFTFPILSGDRHTPLAKPHTAVLTRSTAEKYFGNEDPIGRTLHVNDESDFMVTAVIEDIPALSHIQFDIAFSFETFYLDRPEQRDRWLGDINNYTYILLRNASEAGKVEALFPGLIEKHMGRVLKAVNAECEFFLQPLTRIHLHSNIQGEIGRRGNIAVISIFAAVAAFILLIACFNFMNLATARSTQRAREVGLRKVLGSDRRQLIAQFLFESTIMSFTALLAALLFVKAAEPLFRSLTGTAISVGLFDLIWLVPALIGFAFLVGILAGAYPAFYLSKFRPVYTLKGYLKSGKGGSRFRSLLVVTQFIVSIILIIGTIVVQRQLQYMKNKHLGFNKEQVLVLQVRNDSVIEFFPSVKADLRQIPGVLQVSACSHIPSHGARHNAFLPEGFHLKESLMLGAISVDKDFFDTLGIELAAGNSFDRDLAQGLPRAALINEKAAQRIGWENPVGKNIRELSGAVKKTIIGVVKDFHTTSLHQVIEPLFIEFEPSLFHLFVVRLHSENIPQTMASIEKTWKKWETSGAFEYYFLDQAFDNQYRSEERLGTLFSSFTLLAVFIACLGLFGLAAHAVEQRTKEIGIRKSLGATMGKVSVLLTKDFIRWVLIATVIAWPIAYFAMNKWLQSFAYRVDLGVFPFMLGAAAALAAALLTVGFKSLKAARTNPADALRYE